MRNLKTIIIAVASVAVIGFAINAYARGGKGWDGGYGHHGRGWYHHDDYGQKYDNQMSQEQYEQFQQKQEAFFKDTEDVCWITRIDDSLPPHHFTSEEIESLAETLCDLLHLRVMNPPKSWGLGETCQCGTPDVVQCLECDEELNLASW